MKLWYTTANPSQQNRWGEIDPPEGKKMSNNDKDCIESETIIKANPRLREDVYNTMIVENIDIFYEYKKKGAFKCPLLIAF